jgi:serine/threonine-protein kinase
MMRPLASGLLCVVLAGCSGGSGASPSLSASGPADLDRAAAAARVHATFSRSPDGSPLIYAADEVNQVVWIVDQAGKNQKAIGSITGFSAPKGLAVDSSGNLYVSDVTGSGGSIYVFAPGANSPSRTLTGVPTPYSIAVDGSGNVYSDCVENPSCTQNGVYVFAPNATSPTSTLVDPNLTAILNIAVDAAGDVFVDGDGIGFPIVADEIDEFPAGTTAPVVINSNVVHPNLLAVDAKNNLIVAEGNGDNINVYAPPYNGKPNSSKYTLNCRAGALALNAGDSALWYDCGDRASQLSYPHLKGVESTAKLTRWGLSGLAASPASP